MVFWLVYLICFSLCWFFLLLLISIFCLFQSLVNFVDMFHEGVFQLFNLRMGISISTLVIKSQFFLKSDLIIFLIQIIDAFLWLAMLQGFFHMEWDYWNISVFLPLNISRLKIWMKILKVDKMYWSLPLRLDTIRSSSVR